MLQKMHRKKHLVYVNNNILKSTVFSLNNKWKDKGNSTYSWARCAFFV